MGCFKDADEVYRTIGRLFAEVAADEELAARFKRANTIVQYRHSDPDATITVRMQVAEESEVDFGESEMEPEVVMTMDADTAHRFWLGKVNVMTAIARGEIQTSGPVHKILTLVPLAQPLFARYQAQLAEQGRSDLLEA